MRLQFLTGPLKFDTVLGTAITITVNIFFVLLLSKEVKTKKDKEESDVIFLDSSRLLSKVDNKKVNSSRDMMTEVDFLSANASKYSPKREQELSI